MNTLHLLGAAYVLGLMTTYFLGVPLVYVQTYFNPLQSEKKFAERVGYAFEWPVLAAFSIISIVCGMISTALTKKGSYIKPPAGLENHAN